MKERLLKISRWIKNLLFRPEHFMSVDWGLKNSEIIVIRYWHNTGEMEVIADFYSKKPPSFLEMEKDVRGLAKKYNATVVRDYPRGLDWKDLEL